jgi:hypothetical protein
MQITREEAEDWALNASEKELRSALRRLAKRFEVDQLRHLFLHINAVCAEVEKEKMLVN